MTTKQTERSDRSQLNSTIVAAVIGAVATIAAAFLGNRGTFTEIFPGSPVRIVTVSPTPRVTITVTQSPGPVSPTVYHEGKLVLSDGTEADLDAPPSDLQWGELNLTPGDQYDISGYGNTAIFLENGAQGVQLSPTTGGSCATATGYAGDRIGIDTPPLRIGQYICIHTSEGRLSLLKVLALPAGEIVFNVKTFKNASS